MAQQNIRQLYQIKLFSRSIKQSDTSDAKQNNQQKADNSVM